MNYRTISAYAHMDEFGRPSQITGVLFGGEDRAHKFVIEDKSGNSFSGTVSAKFLRYADDQDVALVGSIEDGKATVTLKRDCYARPGQFKLTVFVTANDSTTAIYCCTGMVDRTNGSGVVDPGGEINLDVDTLVSRINAAVSSWAATDVTSLLRAVAPNYADLTFPVKAGTYCWYDGELYRANVDIPTAESWTLAHWIYGYLGPDIQDLSDRVLRQRRDKNIEASTTDKDLNNYLGFDGWFGISYNAAGDIVHGPEDLRAGIAATVINYFDAMYGATTIQEIITDYASWRRIAATETGVEFMPWTRMDTAGLVRFDTAQTLTDAQKAQARVNIGLSIVDDGDGNIVVS